MPTKEELITPIDIRCKQREAFRLKFTVRERVSGNPVSCRDATCYFVIKEDKGDTALAVDKLTHDMDMSDSTAGIVYVPLSRSDMDMYGDYIGEFEVEISRGNIRKSVDLRFYINPSVR